MTIDHNNICAVIHEPELVTISITFDQMKMLQTIADVARLDESDGDVEREEIADFADALYAEIRDEIEANQSAAS